MQIRFWSLLLRELSSRWIRGQTFMSLIRILPPVLFCINAAMAQISGIRSGVTDDKWDVSSGSVVVSSSGGSIFTIPEHVFGAFADASNPEFQGWVGVDGQPSGYVHFIEWNTPQPVTIRSFKLYAQGDGPRFDNQREMSHFVLKAKSPGSAGFDRILYEFTPQHPYRFVENDLALLLSANVDEVTTQDFRAEFWDRGNTGFSAPRIYELDGFSERLPPRLEVFRAIELAWLSQSDRCYQLQWRPALTPAAWTNLGAPIPGTGSIVYHLESTRETESRVYRVIELTDCDKPVGSDAKRIIPAKNGSQSKVCIDIFAGDSPASIPETDRIEFLNAH
jgi:hypothetical protein